MKTSTHKSAKEIGVLRDVINALNLQKIRITASGGVLTIAGPVYDVHHRLVLEDTAAKVVGVKKIINRMVVTLPQKNSGLAQLLIGLESGKPD